MTSIPGSAPPHSSSSVSIVIPVYNSAATIGNLVDELAQRYDGVWDLEIVLVNDGSADDSAEVCRELVRRHPDSVRFLDLSRNFGEHQAILAGLNRSTGDVVVTMEDDIQTSPDEVEKLIETLRSGNYDVVYGQFEVLRYSWLRRLASWLNGRMATVLLGKPSDLYLSSFRCLSRFLVDEVCRYEGPFPYLDGLILRVTRNYGVTACRHLPRAGGASGYNLRKLLALWLNMFTNFSILPLRLAVVAGFAFAGLGVLLSIAVVIEKLLIPETQIGWSSTVIAIMIFAGLQLMVLGMIGEYLGRVFLSTNRTPQFAVREALGFERSVPARDAEDRAAERQPRAKAPVDPRRRVEELVDQRTR